MTFFESLMRRIEQFFSAVENRTLRVAEAGQQYIRNTRWWGEIFLLVLVAGIVLPVPVGWMFGMLGNGVAGIAILICGMLGAMPIVRISLLGLLVDLFEGFIPDDVRKRIKLVNPTVVVTQPANTPGPVDYDKLFKDHSMFGRLFRMIAMAGMWSMAILMPAATFPVWQHPVAYILSMAAIMLLIYGVAADWNISGFWTRMLRYTAVVMLAYNLARIVAPGWDHLFLVLGLLLFYAGMGRPKVPEKMHGLFDWVAGIILVVVAMSILMPGILHRMTVYMNSFSRYSATQSEYYDQVDQDRNARLKQVNTELAQLEKNRLANKGVLKDEDKKKFDALLIERQLIHAESYRDQVEIPSFDLGKISQTVLKPQRYDLNVVILGAGLLVSILLIGASFKGAKTKK